MGAYVPEARNIQPKHSLYTVRFDKCGADDGGADAKEQADDSGSANSPKQAHLSRLQLHPEPLRQVTLINDRP